MKELTPQILAMYLGCQIEAKGTRGLLRNVNLKGFCTLELSEDIGQDIGCLVEEVKPLLRRLSSMTEEEKRHIYKMIFGREFTGNNISKHDTGKKSEREVWWSGVSRLFFFADGEVAADDDLAAWHVDHYALTVYLLSKSFDLFGLIDAQLAVEKTQ